MAAFEVIALDTATPQLRAPGASDTYTFPRAVEMPLNTANGVLYLNGSKVVTSGSALTFDGTTLGVNGGLVADANLLVQMNSPAGAGRYFASNNAGGYGLLVGYDNSTTTARIRVIPNTPLTFEVNNSEQMRLTSTGLGIGTNNPGAKLQVQDSGGGVLFRAQRTGTDVFDIYQGSGITYLDASAIGGQLVFSTVGAERMRLDSSGNLGLGVTPSAWFFASKVFENESGSLSSYGTGQQHLAQNAYLNSSSVWTYKNSATAVRYEQGSGFHSWFTAPSGTAGNAISFSQVMTLDASGNLVVGTTTADSARLTVMGGSGGMILDDGNGRKLKFDPPGSINSNTAFIGTTTPHALRINSGTSTNEGVLIFSTENTERARIPAAGGMIVGTAALATTATDGFLYVPTCAGTPTGTPTTQTGTAPIVVDTTNNKLYFYSGGQWRDAGP